MVFISFQYKGGSHPNQIRKLAVTTQEPDTVGGYDFDAGGYRKFTRTKMYNERELSVVRVFDATGLSSATCTGIIQDIQQEGLAVYTDNNKIYSLKLDNEPRFHGFQGGTGYNNSIEIVGSNGVKHKMRIWSDSITLDAVGYKNPRDFIAALAELDI